MPSLKRRRSRWGRAVLMAAGCGTRIQAHIGEYPKSALEVGGEPLIRRTVKQLLERKLAVTVVLGYRREIVAQALSGLPVEVVYNPFYNITNSIVSLWFARHVLHESPLLLINGDVYMDSSILDMALADKRTPVMFADPRRVEKGDFFLGVDERRLLRVYGKGLPVAQRTAEYIGLAKLEVGSLPQFRQRLQLLVEKQNHDAWWEQVLYSLTDEGGEVYVGEIGDRFWSEIDEPEDYERLQRVCTIPEAVDLGGREW